MDNMLTYLRFDLEILLAHSTAYKMRCFVMNVDVYMEFSSFSCGLLVMPFMPLCAGMLPTFTRTHVLDVVASASYSALVIGSTTVSMQSKESL